MVMSGKGGVGKSTVATNLAVHLMLATNVGLLDVDIHGPSIPQMLHSSTPAWSATKHCCRSNIRLKVMSIGFLLPNADDAVIWRGPMKMTVIRQFLQDVAWGDLIPVVDRRLAPATNRCRSANSPPSWTARSSSPRPSEFPPPTSAVHPLARSWTSLRWASWKT